MTPTQAVRTHPAVRSAHETLHRALENATDPQVLRFQDLAEQMHTLGRTMQRERR